MSGTTIGNWGKFEKNLFKGMSGVPDKDVDKLTKGENGVLATRLSEVKSGHIHASSVKKFFLGIITLGIYNICHGISAKNQRATQAALKEGVDNVHCALSYLSMMCQKEVQEKGAGNNVLNFDENYVKTAPDIRPFTEAERDFLKGTAGFVLLCGVGFSGFCGAFPRRRKPPRRSKPRPPKRRRQKPRR